MKVPEIRKYKFKFIQQFSILLIIRIIIVNYSHGNKYAFIIILIFLNYLFFSFGCFYPCLGLCLYPIFLLLLVWYIFSKPKLQFIWDVLMKNIAKYQVKSVISNLYEVYRFSYQLISIFVRIIRPAVFYTIWQGNH